MQLFGLEFERMNSELRALNQSIRRHNLVMQRIKLPDDLHSVTTEGAWLKVKNCPLPSFIEGQARGTHKIEGGKVYRLVAWDELEHPVKYWWMKNWKK